jgi:hypothetical protein
MPFGSRIRKLIQDVGGSEEEHEDAEAERDAEAEADFTDDPDDDDAGSGEGDNEEDGESAEQDAGSHFLRYMKIAIPVGIIICGSRTRIHFIDLGSSTQN